MEKIEYPQLTEAVLLWTGWKREAWPRFDDASVVSRFGPELAAKLLSVIRTLKDDFYSSDASLVAADLQEMGKMATEEFKIKHPEISEEIVKAFAWCYTFDNR